MVQRDRRVQPPRQTQIARFAMPGYEVDLQQLGQMPAHLLSRNADVIGQHLRLRRSHAPSLQAGQNDSFRMFGVQELMHGQVVFDRHDDGPINRQPPALCPLGDPLPIHAKRDRQPVPVSLSGDQAFDAAC